MKNSTAMKEIKMEDTKTSHKRDPRMPLIDQVRELTLETTPPDDALDFYATALKLGCTPSQAEKIGETLTVRMMRRLGAI
jgi:hypothetical protein